MNRHSSHHRVVATLVNFSKKLDRSRDFFRDIAVRPNDFDFVHLAKIIHYYEQLKGRIKNILLLAHLFEVRRTALVREIKPDLTKFAKKLGQLSEHIDIFLVNHHLEDDWLPSWVIQSPVQFSEHLDRHTRD